MLCKSKEFGRDYKKLTFPSSSPCMGLGLSSGIFEPAPLSFGPVRSVLDSIEHGASIAQKGTTTKVIRVVPVAQLSIANQRCADKTIRGEPAMMWATIAPQPCIRCGMIERTSRSSQTMMQSCASRRGSSGRAHSLTRREAMDSVGSPPPRIVLALHHAEADERRTVSDLLLCSV